MTNTSWLIVVVIVGVAAFAVGLHAAREPDTKIEYRESARAVETFGVLATLDVVRDVATDTQTTRIVYRERDPDGAERVLEQTTTGTQTREHSEEQGVRVEYVDREVVREVEHRVEVATPLPDWRAAALVGVDLGGSIAYGAQVERRILGPVAIGAWGHTGGAVGASLSLSF